MCGRFSLGADAAPEQNVLILESFSIGDRIDSVEHLKSSLRSRTGAPVNFNLEYLEALRFETPGYEDSLVQTLNRAYGGTKLDLLVVDFYPALQFAMKHRAELFPNVPIMMWGSPARESRARIWGRALQE